MPKTITLVLEEQTAERLQAYAIEMEAWANERGFARPYGGPRTTEDWAEGLILKALEDWEKLKAAANAAPSTN